MEKARKLPWASSLKFEERTVGFRAGRDEYISRISNAKKAGRLDEAVAILLRRLSVAPTRTGAEEAAGGGLAVSGFEFWIDEEVLPAGLSTYEWKVDHNVYIRYHLPGLLSSSPKQLEEQRLTYDELLRGLGIKTEADTSTSTSTTGAMEEFIYRNFDELKRLAIGIANGIANGIAGAIAIYLVLRLTERDMEPAHWRIVELAIGWKRLHKDLRHLVAARLALEIGMDTEEGREVIYEGLERLLGTSEKDLKNVFQNYDKGLERIEKNLIEWIEERHRNDLDRLIDGLGMEVLFQASIGFDLLGTSARKMGFNELDINLNSDVTLGDLLDALKGKFPNTSLDLLRVFPHADPTLRGWAGWIPGEIYGSASLPTNVPLEVYDTTDFSVNAKIDGRGSSHRGKITANIGNQSEVLDPQLIFLHRRRITNLTRERSDNAVLIHVCDIESTLYFLESKDYFRKVLTYDGQTRFEEEGRKLEEGKKHEWAREEKMKAFINLFLLVYLDPSSKSARAKEEEGSTISDKDYCKNSREATGGNQGAPSAAEMMANKQQMSLRGRVIDRTASLIASITFDGKSSKEDVRKFVLNASGMFLDLEEVLGGMGLDDDYVRFGVKEVREAGYTVSGSSLSRLGAFMAAMAWLIAARPVREYVLDKRICDWDWAGRRRYLLRRIGPIARDNKLTCADGKAPDALSTYDDPACAPIAARDFMAANYDLRNYTMRFGLTVTVENSEDWMDWWKSSVEREGNEYRLKDDSPISELMAVVLGGPRGPMELYERRGLTDVIAKGELRDAKVNLINYAILYRNWVVFIFPEGDFKEETREDALDRLKMAHTNRIDMRLLGERWMIAWMVLLLGMLSALSEALIQYGELIDTYLKEEGATFNAMRDVTKKAALGLIDYYDVEVISSTAFRSLFEDFKATSLVDELHESFMKRLELFSSRDADATAHDLSYILVMLTLGLLVSALPTIATRIGLIDRGLAALSRVVFAADIFIIALILWHHNKALKTYLKRFAVQIFCLRGSRLRALYRHCNSLINTLNCAMIRLRGRCMCCCRRGRALGRRGWRKCRNRVSSRTSSGGPEKAPDAGTIRLIRELLRWGRTS
ncbi:MAG: hypothetical protein ACP5UD_08535 [Conexivisphaera sp.]